MAEEVKSTVVSSDAQKAFKIGNKVVPVHSSIGSRLATHKSEYEARLPKIDSAVASAIASGKMRLEDAVMYGVKPLKGNLNQELFEAADQKEVGLRNLNNRKLEANHYTLLNGIQLLVAEVGENPTDESLRLAEYKPISSDWHPEFANGEFELKFDTNVVIPRVSNEIFKTDRGNEYKNFKGYYELECPVMIPPMTDVIPQIWLPVGTKTSNLAVKVVMHGVKAQA